MEDTELVRGFYAGDPEACARIDSWIYLVIRNPRWGLRGDTEDVFQDVRLRLLQSLKAWRGECSLKTYACRIAMYACADRLDAISRNREIAMAIPPEVPDPRPGPDEEREKRRRLEVLARIVRDAPPEYRTLWQMIYFDCLPFSEIARRLGVKWGTIKSRSARYRQDTRRKYEGAI